MSEIQVVDTNTTCDQEKELVEKPTKLENDIGDQGENQLTKIQELENELQVRTEERENYKNKVNLLETELNDLKNQQPETLNPAQTKQVEQIKVKSEELLTKAKGIIFDKTKICKNQELQIESLNLQVSSLKEALSITKDLLNIRNLEIEHLQDKLNCMEQKIAIERERQTLMNQKVEAMMKMNSDLKVEYETQLQLFNVLREKYSERDDLVQQNKSKTE